MHSDGYLENRKLLEQQNEVTNNSVTSSDTVTVDYRSCAENKDGVKFITSRCNSLAKNKSIGIHTAFFCTVWS